MNLNFLSKFSDHALLLVRLAFGGRLIYGTQDNILSWERMIEFSSFLESNGFPIPTICAVVSVYLQFFSGLAWIVGFKVRFFSSLMIGNFIVALLMVHIGDSYLGSAPAIHLITISLLLMTVGGGKFGVSRE